VITLIKRRRWSLKINGSLSHWEREGTHHGAKSMPRIMAMTSCRINPYLEPHPEWSGRRLWLYFRGGYALYVEFFIDRRTLP
jgi:hypothetical protein